MTDKHLPQSSFDISIFLDDDIVHCLYESFPSTVEIGEEIFRFIAKGKSVKSSDRIKEIGRLLMIFKCPRKVWEKPTIFSILTQDVGGGDAF